MNNVWYAIGLTVFAGLSTGIGGLIVMFMKGKSTKFLSISLGFSAGVMIYVSFGELLTESRTMLSHVVGDEKSALYSVAAFFGGIFLTAIIDKLVPDYENPHETHSILEMDQCEIPQTADHHRLMRTGLLTAIVIAVHNFPEGMATFIAAVQTPSLGLVIAIAIAIHNIPEGISVAVPVYCATGSKRKAFGWALLSGLGEPLGAILAYFILLPFLNDAIFGVLFGIIAGIMVYISFDELLPSAREYGEHHLTIYGLISGMMVMAASLIILG